MENYNDNIIKYFEDKIFETISVNKNYFNNHINNHTLTTGVLYQTKIINTKEEVYNNLSKYIVYGIPIIDPSKSFIIKPDIYCNKSLFERFMKYVKNIYKRLYGIIRKWLFKSANK